MAKIIFATCFCFSGGAAYAAAQQQAAAAAATTARRRLSQGPDEIPTSPGGGSSGSAVHPPTFSRQSSRGDSVGRELASSSPTPSGGPPRRLHTRYKAPPLDLLTYIYIHMQKDLKLGKQSYFRPNTRLAYMYFKLRPHFGWPTVKS